MGVQYASATDNDGSAISKLLGFVTTGSPDTAPSPSFWELASVTDNSRAYNIAVIAYWPSKALYTEWAAASGFQEWWQEVNPEDERFGWFLEVFFPSIDRLETLFTHSDVPEGAAHMREGPSGPVQEHGYWGSMRDRLPASQTDALEGEKWNCQVSNENLTGALVEKSTTLTPMAEGAGSRRRIRVPGKQNLAVIRSGQDWSNTAPEERKLYLETMHPVLIKGMDFLRDNGHEVGCYSCRFMEILDPVSQKADKDRTFGLAYFDNLSSLEGWSRQHKTHLAIFGRFLQYAKELGNNISLRAWHEVLVLTPEQQSFEYIGCHEKTGMLVSLMNCN
jgi:hypothetical protein